MAPDPVAVPHWRRLATVLAQITTVAAAAAALVVLTAPWWWVGDCASHWHLHLLVLGLWPLLVLRRWWLVPVCASAAVFAGPLLVPAPPATVAPPAAMTPVVVVGANVWAGNRDPAATAAALLAQEADLLAVVELTEDLHRELRAGDPKLVAVIGGRFGGMGMGFYTRLPMTRRELHELGGLPILEITVATGAGPLRVLVVHPPPPIGGQRFALRNLLLAEVADLAASSPDPVVVLGDFNCTPASPVWRHLLSRGALRSSGGTPRTWPVPLAPIGLAIDHILTGPGLRAEGLETAAIPGSDHRALRATIVPDVVGVREPGSHDDQ